MWSFAAARLSCGRRKPGAVRRTVHHDHFRSPPARVHRSAAVQRAPWPGSQETRRSRSCGYSTPRREIEASIGVSEHCVVRRQRHAEYATHRPNAHTPQLRRACRWRPAQAARMETVLRTLDYFQSEQAERDSRLEEPIARLLPTSTPSLAEAGFACTPQASVARVWLHEDLWDCERSELCPPPRPHSPKLDSPARHRRA